MTSSKDFGSARQYDLTFFFSVWYWSSAVSEDFSRGQASKKICFFLLSSRIYSSNYNARISSQRFPLKIFNVFHLQNQEFLFSIGQNKNRQIRRCHSQQSLYDRILYYCQCTAPPREDNNSFLLLISSTLEQSSPTSFLRSS
jgi:hypothetical protein